MAYQEYSAEGAYGSRQVSREMLQERIADCRKIYQANMARAVWARTEAEICESEAASIKEQFDYHVAIEAERFGGSESSTTSASVSTQHFAPQESGLSGE